MDFLALDFIHRSNLNPRRVVLFPGSWNPPTVAHLDIARTALQQADEVVWVLPRAFPHKSFDGVHFEGRVSLLEMLMPESDRFSAAVSAGGLYAEIAEEARDHLGPRADISLLLGRDAAERIANWDYGTPGFFDCFVRQYKLMVAARHGDHTVAPRHLGRIETLPMNSSWDDVSSSEVRRRIQTGEEWRHLVPPSLVLTVEKVFGAIKP